MSEDLENFLKCGQDAQAAIDEILAEANEEEESGCPEGTPKLDSDYAGYMELPGAEKDGGCKIVNVKGGVSKEKGCCNLFHPVDGADKFSCGTCEYED